MDHMLSSLFHLHWRLSVAFRVHLKLLTIKSHNLKTSYLPILLQLIVYVSLIRVSVRSQELTKRPLLIAPLPTLSHISGTNCQLNYPVQMLLFSLKSKFKTALQASLQFVLLFLIFYRLLINCFNML